MVRGEIRFVSFSLRALIFTTDNIVKQDFMSVRLFDNCYDCLDHTKHKNKNNCHKLLLDQGFKFQFGPLSTWYLYTHRYIPSLGSK